MNMHIDEHLRVFVTPFIDESSYKKVAAKIGMSSTYLWEVVNGDKRPSFKILRKICNALADNPNSKYAFLSTVLLRDKKEAFALSVDRERVKYAKRG